MDTFINRMWLIESQFNPADTLTKRSQNPTLLNIIRTNQHVVPTKRVFRLQYSYILIRNLFQLVKFRCKDINYIQKHLPLSLSNSLLPLLYHLYCAHSYLPRIMANTHVKRVFIQHNRIKFLVIQEK